jgi:Putative zinc-finger
MTGGHPDYLPPDWLAAYADGELTDAERARVERHLAEHPEARETLEGQEALAPGNAEFWAAVRAPEPSAGQWANTLAGVRAHAPARPARRWAAWLGTVGLMATAATVLLTLPAGDPPGPVPTPNPVAGPPAEDDRPYAMATDADVRIISLPEAAAELLLVGAHPLGDALVILARADEVAVHGVGPDAAGKFPEIPADPAAPDPPFLWAPRER